MDYRFGLGILRRSTSYIHVVVRENEVELEVI